jgi:hypothetical protein
MMAMLPMLLTPMVVAVKNGANGKEPNRFYLAFSLSLAISLSLSRALSLSLARSLSSFYEY